MKIKASELKKTYVKKVKTTRKEVVKKELFIQTQEEEKETHYETNPSKVVYTANLPVIREDGCILYGSLYIPSKFAQSCVDSLKKCINELSNLWSRPTPQQKIYLLTLQGKLEKLEEGLAQCKKKQ
jgi:hypothetical protein